MKRTEIGTIEDTNTGPSRDEAHATSAEPAVTSRAKAVQTEVPCCCPGCFSFDF